MSSSTRVDAPSTIGDPGPARTRRRRPLGRWAVTVLLLGLTAFNATRSPWLREARSSEAKGNYEVALTAALTHLRRRPWSGEAHRIAARCLSRLDFPDLAEDHYRGQPLEVVDRHYRAYGLVRSDFRDRAVEAYRQILAIRPDDIAALRAQAGVLLASGRWDEVVRLGRALQALPEGPALAESPIAVRGRWTLRPARVESVRSLGSTLEAIAYHDDGEAGASVLAFERVVALDPELRSMPLAPALFWSSFASDLLKLGRAAEAVEILERALARDDDPELRLLLGVAFEQSGSIEGAERAWRGVLDRAPEKPGAWLNLGRLALQRDDPAEAVRRLEHAQALLPRSYDAAYNLGLAYRRLGRPGDARVAEERAVQLRNRSIDQPRGMGSPPIARPDRQASPQAPPT